MTHCVLSSRALYHETKGRAKRGAELQVARGRGQVASGKWQVAGCRWQVARVALAGHLGAGEAVAVHRDKCAGVVWCAVAGCGTMPHKSSRSSHPQMRTSHAATNDTLIRPRPHVGVRTPRTCGGHHPRSAEFASPDANDRNAPIIFQEGSHYAPKIPHRRPRPLHHHRGLRTLAHFLSGPRLSFHWSTA
jgi:hypothetical protein